MLFKKNNQWLEKDLCWEEKEGEKKVLGEVFSKGKGRAE